MTDRIKILGLALLLAAGLMLASFSAGWSLRGHQQQPPVADTIRIHTTDTVILTEKIHDTITHTYFKTIQVPFYIVDTDTIVDSVWVSLPYERHFASLDSVADVWYSGYDAKIDSAVVYKHTTTQIIHQPYEVARMPRLTLDVGVAAFYSDKSINPCLVGEMRYNATHTTFSAFGAVNHKGEWGAGVGVTYRINLIK
jgi:hypothetical protein